MGSGLYSSEVRSARATTAGYYTKSASEIFEKGSINNAMNPSGILLRESRDSDDHPNSVPIIIGLDVTGSMGSVPHHLVKDGLPNMMSTIIEGGVKDPQVLFLAIGDHECDRSPLQVGQFESNDELLDKWLTSVYLEGGGGGNAGESYLLAWFFAAHYTDHDAIEKRGEKGYLFTIGDEPTLKTLPASAQKDIMGAGQYSTVSSVELLEKAQEKYNVYHIHISETYAGGRITTVDGWKQILGDNVIVVQSKNEVAEAIAKLVSQKPVTNNDECEVLVETVDEVDEVAEEML